MFGPQTALDTARKWLPPTYRAANAPAERRWELRRLRGEVWAAMVEEEAVAIRPALVMATEALLSDMELWVAEYARNKVFVHAGCVVKDGQAIVLPGRSMSGKSSLTAALVRAGGVYYSDEYTVLDHRGLVRAYPRPLNIRPHSGSEGRSVPVEALGMAARRGPAHVKLVAALRYDLAAGWNIESLTPSQAALRLLDNTVAARTRPRAVLTALEALTKHLRAFEGTRGDADQAAALLLEMLSS